MGGTVVDAPKTHQDGLGTSLLETTLEAKNSVFLDVTQSRFTGREDDHVETSQVHHGDFSGGQDAVLHIGRQGFAVQDVVGARKEQTRVIEVGIADGDTPRVAQYGGEHLSALMLFVETEAVGGDVDDGVLFAAQGLEVLLDSSLADKHVGGDVMLHELLADTFHLVECSLQEVNAATQGKAIGNGVVEVKNRTLHGEVFIVGSRDEFVGVAVDALVELSHQFGGQVVVESAEDGCVGDGSFLRPLS